MTRRLLPLLLAGTLLASGCDLAPHYVRPGLAAPATLPQHGPYPALSTDADPTAIGWKAFFVDPKLRDTIALGLVNNRDLRVSAANVIAARAEYRVQRADLFPTINASASGEYSHTGSQGAVIGSTGTTTGTGTTAGTGTTTGTGTTVTRSTTAGSNYHDFSVDLGVSAYELDLFGRVRNLTKASLEQYFSTRSARDSARISLIAEIADAWLTMASDLDQLHLSQSTLKSFQQTLTITQQQFDRGIISELDVQQAETSVQSARLDVAKAQALAAQDQNALDLLVGTTVPQNLLPSGLGAGDYTMPDLPANLSSAVLLKRPDVLEAEHTLKAQNADIGAARAAFFPEISLTAAAGTASTALGGLFSAGTFTYSGSGNILQTVFDFGRNAANLRYAKAEKQAAVATYEKAVQTAFREVADALATRGTIDTQIDAAEKDGAAAQRAAALSLARYRGGIDPFLDTLTSQRTLYSAQQTLVTTRLLRESNLVTLYNALGGGLQDGTPPAQPVTPPAA